mmetsp:Transcript_43653/g.57840  ORF Transcript_43653/g.57840 Transcript_43653/m.57840 type:complete len:107 (+) Transcript_43653:341-661(+)
MLVGEIKGNMFPQRDDEDEVGNETNRQTGAKKKKEEKVAEACQETRRHAKDQRNKRRDASGHLPQEDLNRSKSAQFGLLGRATELFVSHLIALTLQGHRSILSGPD